MARGAPRASPCSRSSIHPAWSHATTTARPRRRGTVGAACQPCRLAWVVGARNRAGALTAQAFVRPYVDFAAPRHGRGRGSRRRASTRGSLSCRRCRVRRPRRHGQRASGAVAEPQASVVVGQAADLSAGLAADLAADLSAGLAADLPTGQVTGLVTGPVVDTVVGTAADPVAACSAVLGSPVLGTGGAPGTGSGKPGPGHEADRAGELAPWEYA